MRSDRPVPVNSRAFLIGVSNYQDHAAYPSYRAVGNSLEGMFEVLTDPDLCGWSKDSVELISSPMNAAQLITRLRRLARQTTGVLLFYFVGHGVLTQDLELCLAISDTDSENPDATGLEYVKIRRMLYDGTPAATRIAILDCCYSGRAIGLAAANAQLADLSAAVGTYTLTAADDIANVDLGQDASAYTALTGELLELIRSGIPGGPPELTLADLYPHLWQRLHRKSLPHPNQRGDHLADRFVFTRNAVTPAEASDVQDIAEPAPATAMFNATELRALELMEEGRPWAAIAEELKLTDPGIYSEVIAQLLVKLGVLTQRHAVLKARELGILLNSRSSAAPTESNLAAQEATAPTEAGAADVPPLDKRTGRAVGINVGTSEAIYGRLLRERIIVLGAQIEEENANQISAQMLFLAAEDATKDIRLYINSPGGSVTAGMAIYDTMQLIECDVATYAIGLAAGMAQVLLSAGTPGKRYALPQARILLRGPTVGDGVAESDRTIQAEMLDRHRGEMAELIAHHTGQTAERILADWDPERWFSVEQAREYGLLDHVFTRADEPKA